MDDVMITIPLQEYKAMVLAQAKMLVEQEQAEKFAGLQKEMEELKGSEDRWYRCYLNAQKELEELKRQLTCDGTN